MILVFVCFLCAILCGQIPRVSVVIPVHNREGTLSACLNSVIKQSLRSLEIICVDDGSMDDSLKIIKNFANNDKRVVVLHQENCGVSCARNTGLAVATGEFVNFIDSDDWIELDTYEVVYQKAKQSHADVVLWGRVVSRFGTRKYSGPIKESLFRSDYLVPRLSFPERNSVCTKLYKRSVLKDNGVKFDVSVRFGEDTLFNLDLIPLVNGIFCLNRSFYHYTPSIKGLNLGRQKKDIKNYTDALFRHMYQVNNKHVAMSKRNIKAIKLFAKQIWNS